MTRAPGPPLLSQVPDCYCCSVVKSCPTLCDPMDCSTPGFPVLHYLLEFAQIHVYWVSDAIQCYLMLCSPLLLLPSIFPSIRVFSNESALHIMWPKYWSFSFNISPSNEYSELISFKIDWLDLLEVQGTSSLIPGLTGSSQQPWSCWWWGHTSWLVNKEAEVQGERWPVQGHFRMPVGDQELFPSFLAFFSWAPLP